MNLVFLTMMLMGWGSALRPLISSNCPSDWIDAHAEGCFKFLFSDTNTTWFDAQFACERDGGFLAEPKTLEQMEFLRGIASLEESFYGIKFWWMGLSDIGHEGVWTWQHSMEVSSRGFWDEGSPSEQAENSLDCGYLSLTNQGLAWKDGDFRSSSIGNNLIAPICQRETDAPDHTTTTERSGTTPEDFETSTREIDQTTSTAETTSILPKTTTQVSGCPDAWSQLEGSCFLILGSGSYEQMNWLDAREKCRSIGGDLASIHSHEQDIFIYNMIKADGLLGNFWVGGTDSQSEGIWTWSNGSPWDYENWRTDGNQGVEYNCLSHTYHSELYWNDFPCSKSLPFICQLN